MDIKQIETQLRVLEPNLDFHVYRNKTWKVSGAAFTMNKKYIFLCADTRDYNVLMYVALHELAHIKSASWGHDQQFIDAFRDLVRRALDKGFYRYQNYAFEPVKYCNFELNSQIL